MVWKIKSREDVEPGRIKEKSGIGATIVTICINTFMQNKTDDIKPNNGFRENNFEEEKNKADSIEKQNAPANNDPDKQAEQKILKEQKETD